MNHELDSVIQMSARECTNNHTALLERESPMLVSRLAPAYGHPHVQNFIVSLIDMQLSDVRAMLQLPRPDIGITPGCNFAILSSLCNLISGISTTIFKPPSLLHEVRSPNCGS